MIKCRNAELGYDGKAVVSDLNFNISAGDYLCILGENGSGKSTLLKGIAGLISPLGGKLEVSVQKNGIGYLSQITNNGTGFPASVREVVMSGFCGKPGRLFFYSSSQKQIAEKNMELMNVASLADKNIARLSGGQRQRVYLARALCAGSRLLLLDEPAASLDSASANELYSSVKLINDSGVTVVMVSHDTDASLKYASHILHLGSKQLFFGKPDDYRAQGGDWQ